MANGGAKTARIVGVAFLTLISVVVVAAVVVANRAGGAPDEIEVVTATTMPASSTTVGSTTTTTLAAARVTTTVAPPARTAQKGVSVVAPATTKAPAAHPAPAAVTTTVVPKPVVFYLHAMYEDPQNPARPDILAAVAGQATLVVPNACGLANWGDACVIEDLHRLKLVHSPDRPVEVLAMSMGNIVLGNWKARYPNDVQVAVGLLPVTTTLVEPLLNVAPASLDPPRPWGMSHYVCWYAQEDVFGPPVAGTCTETHAVPGGHVASAPFPVTAILDVLVPGAW